MDDFRFNTVDVKQYIVDALVGALPKFGHSDVKVLRADPLTPTEIPCIGLNRTTDDETSQSIADVIQEPVYNSTTGVYTVTKGTYFNEAIEARVWHTNADERDKLYPVVKAVLVAIRPDLVQAGLLNVTIRGGRDEQDTTMQQAPTPLYWGCITISFLNPLEVVTTDIVPTITSIMSITT